MNKRDSNRVMDPDIASEIFSKTAEVIRAYDNAFGASVKASQAFFDLQTILPPCMRMGVITGIPPSGEIPIGSEESISPTTPVPSSSSALKSPTSAKSKPRKAPYPRSKPGPASVHSPSPSQKERKQGKSPNKVKKEEQNEPDVEDQEKLDKDLLRMFLASYHRRMEYNKVSQKQIAAELNELSNGATAVVQGTMSKLIRGIAVPKDSAIVTAIYKWIEQENARANEYGQQKAEGDPEEEPSEDMQEELDHDEEEEMEVKEMEEESILTN